MPDAVDRPGSLWASKAVGVLKELGASVMDFCFPRVCAGCQSESLISRDGFWCDECLKNLPWIESPLCSCCGLPFYDSPSSPEHLCGECIGGRQWFDTARAATLYAGVVRDLIHQLKFGGRLHWVPSLVQLLDWMAQKGDTPAGDIILPVPLHLKRLRQRGFNQAALVGKMLGRLWNVPVMFDVLVRENWTEPQTRLNRKERLQNVRGAFGVTRPSILEGRSVILVDDVFTTGTTISECAMVVRRAGASEVHAVTICRALPDRKLLHESI